MKSNGTTTTTTTTDGSTKETTSNASSASSRMISTIGTILLVGLCGFLFINLFGGNPYCGLNVKEADHIVMKQKSSIRSTTAATTTTTTTTTIPSAVQPGIGNSLRTSTNNDKKTKNKKRTNLPPISSYGTVKEAIESMEKEYAAAEEEEESSNENENNDNYIPIVSNIYTKLPKRQITIFGLESSGVQFVTNTFIQTLRFDYDDDSSSTTSSFQKTELPDNDYISSNHEIRIQSIILPTLYSSTDGTTGSNNNDQEQAYLRENDIVPPIATKSYVPKHCITGSTSTTIPTDCQEIFGMKEGEPSTSSSSANTMHAYVNITEYIQWYRQHDVSATAVIVIRDPGLHFHGIVNHVERNNNNNNNKNNVNLTETNQEIAFEQYERGVSIIQEAIYKLHQPTEIVVLSYETLMSLQNPYLQSIYSKLQILPSSTSTGRYSDTDVSTSSVLTYDKDIVPNYKNGNIKYVQTTPLTMRQRLSKDKIREQQEQRGRRRRRLQQLR